MPEQPASEVAVVGPLDGTANLDPPAGMTVDVAPEPLEFDTKSSCGSVAMWPIPGAYFVIAEEDLNCDVVHA